MTRFFNYYNSLCVGANSPNVFSFDPFVLAIKDLLISELSQIVFYIEKLKDLDVDMSVYRDKVIEFISILIVNLDFKRESFFTIVEDLYENKFNLQQLYNSICNERNLQPEKLYLDSSNLSSKESILKSLNDHEKNISASETFLSYDKKILYQIMVNLVLNACNCLIDLKDYGVDFIEAKEEVLKLFNISNSPSLSETDWIDKIKEFSKCNYKIMKKLNEVVKQKYGPIQEINVCCGVKTGNAILVSGYNFSDLEKILNAVQGLDINVYTHHEMINAFKYQKFHNNQNLIAHYQRSNNNFSLDFSSFPGPIYISKNSTPKIDVIRGQIFTSAKYPSFGIAKIENDDFTPLIDYALSSDGFKENNLINTIQIGYSEKNLMENLNSICNKFSSGEIIHITFIGLFDKLIETNNYIETFLEKIPNDCFVISFTNLVNGKNIWNVNSFYDFSLVYLILENLIKRIDNPSENISIFLYDCNSNVISHIFNLIYLGISKIFLGPCCPNLLNPSLIDGLKNLFSISEISNPKDDIKQILK